MKIARALAMAMLLVLVLAACAEDDPAVEPAEDDPAVEPPEEPEEPAEDPETPADDPETPADDPGVEDAATVAVAETDLGEVLVDAEGMTLYLFEPDEQGESTCYDECADNWPPLLTEEDPGAGDGVDETLLGTTERDDGTTQVTYDGWPLYRWAADAAPGDTTGQGVQDVWWVVGADGAPIRDAPDAAGNESGSTVIDDY